MIKTLYFLSKDYAVLEKNVASLQENLKTAGREAGEIADQSSETWHDNYGFEEADRERKRLLRRLDELKQILAHAEIVEPSDNVDQVALGKTVTIRNAGMQEDQVFLVGSYMVLEKIVPYEFSYAAPILSPLLGTSIGDVREVLIGDQIISMKVVNIGRFPESNATDTISVCKNHTSASPRLSAKKSASGGNRENP